MLRALTINSVVPISMSPSQSATTGDDRRDGLPDRHPLADRARSSASSPVRDWTYTAIRGLSRQPKHRRRRSSLLHTRVNTGRSGILLTKSGRRSIGVDALAVRDRRRMSVFYHGHNPPSTC